MSDEPGGDATVPGEPTGGHVPSHHDGRSTEQLSRIHKSQLRTDGGETAKCVRCGADTRSEVRYCSTCRGETANNPAQYPSQSRKAATETVETTDPEPDLYRRGLLIGGTTSLIGAAYLLREPIMGIMNGVIHSVGRYWRDQQLSEVGLLDVTWAGGNLVLEFDPDHRADGWSIAHEQADPIDGAVVLGSTDGENDRIKLPFSTLVDKRKDPLPDRSLVYTVFEGSFSGWSTDPRDHGIESSIGSIQFDAPETAVPADE